MPRNSVTQMDARRKLAQMEARERRRIRRKWHIGTFGHFLTVFFTLLIAIIVVVAMVVGQFLTGPSSTATDIMAQTLMQTSALKFVPYLYLFENTDAVIARNTVLSSNQVTDASLVTIKAHLQDETDDPAEKFIRLWESFCYRPDAKVRARADVAGDALVKAFLAKDKRLDDHKLGAIRRFVAMLVREKFLTKDDELAKTFGKE